MMRDILIYLSTPWIIDPRYLKLPSLEMTCESSPTSNSASHVTSLNLDSRYSVLVLLNFKPLDSRDYLQTSNLSLTPPIISSIRTISSANNIHQGTSPSVYDVISSQLYKSQRVSPKYYNERLAEEIRKKAST